MNFKCLKVFAIEGSLCPCAKMKLWKRRKKRHCQRAPPPPSVIQLKNENSKNKRFIYTQRLTKVQGRNFSVASRVWWCNAHIHTHSNCYFLWLVMLSRPLAQLWMANINTMQRSLFVRDRVSSSTNGKHCLSHRRWTPCGFFTPDTRSTGCNCIDRNWKWNCLCIFV